MSWPWGVRIRLGMAVNSGACGNFSLKFIGSQKSDIGLSLNSKLTEKCFCISVTSNLSLAKATVEVRQSSSNFRLCGRSFSRPMSVCRSLTVFQYLKYLQVVPKYPQLPNIHRRSITRWLDCGAEHNHQLFQMPRHRSRHTYHAALQCIFVCLSVCPWNCFFDRVFCILVHYCCI